MAFQIGNTITDIGELYARNIIGFNNATSQNATKYIAWGNCTITQTKTILDAEATTACFNRSNAITPIAWDNSGDYAFNLTLSVIANATVNINACSVHWSPTASSDNNMFALAALPQATTANSGDNFTAVWVFTFDFN
jgi:hypothetical protein